MLSDEQDAEVARIRERWSNGPTKRYPEATEAADQRDIESLLAMLDAARAAERALVERIEAVLATTSSWRAYESRDVGDVYDALTVTDLIIDLRAALRPEAATTEGAWSTEACPEHGDHCAGGSCCCADRHPAAAVHPDTEGER